MIVTVAEAVQIGVLLAAFAGPVLVYVIARTRLQHDKSTTHASHAWERMATLVERYGARADALEARVVAAEAHTESLRTQVLGLQQQLAQWRAFATALQLRSQEAGGVVLDPADYGLHDSHD